jgi:peptidoglycan-associated lipoprotein
MLLVPVTGCGKRVATSAGDAEGTSKGKTAAAPVETINPDPFPPLPEEKRAGSTIDTARESAEPAPRSSSGGMTGEPGAPPAAGSSPSVPGAASASGEAMSLADIFFDFDQHSIRRDAQSTLSSNADWINSTPGKAIVIEGHCDERGTQAYNLVLGEKRARSVKRYLEDLGVPAARLKTTSYGELRPFCKERDESCYQQNRRAHFVAH